MDCGQNIHLVLPPSLQPRIVEYKTKDCPSSGKVVITVAPEIGYSPATGSGAQEHQRVLAAKFKIASYVIYCLGRFLTTIWVSEVGHGEGDGHGGDDQRRAGGGQGHVHVPQVPLLSLGEAPEG